MSVGNFDTCFNFTIGEEGKYSAARTDPGNWSSGEVGVGEFVGSCWGISAPTLINWLGPVMAKAVTADYMKNLSISIAKTIYQRDYWVAVCGDQLPAGLDLAVWDFGVNAGVGRSAKMLQELLGVDADGNIGPVTLDAVKKADTKNLITRLIEKHKTFYENDPLFSIDGNGWINRQNALLASSMTMAS